MDEKVMTKSFPVLVDLIQLRLDSRSSAPVKDQIKIIEQGLQFLVIYLNILTLFSLGEHHEGKYLNFAAMNRMKEMLQKKGIIEIGVRAIGSRSFKDWDTLALELLDEIQGYKQCIREDLSLLADGLCNYYWFKVDCLLEFIRHTDRAMNNVLQLKGDQMIPYEKMKFESTKEKLGVFRIVFNFVKGSHIMFRDFHCALSAWACNAAYLCLFYWVRDDESIAYYKRKEMLSKLYRNFDSPHPKVTEYCLKYMNGNKIFQQEGYEDSDVVSPDVTSICLSYLKAREKLDDKKCREASEIHFGFIESLHWNLRAYLPKDAIKTLLDAMIFLTAFVTDPLSSRAKEGRLALSKSKEVLKEAETIIISLGRGEKDEADIVEARNFLFYDFFEMIITIKAEVRKAYPLLFLDASFNFPRINILNLLDSSIEKIKSFLIYFPKHPITNLKKELVVLRDLLKVSNLEDNFVIQLQNECIGFKDLWTQISNVAYQVDRIIASNTNGYGLGIDIFFLLDVQEELRRLCPKVKTIKDKYLQDLGTFKNERNLIDIVPLNSNVQEMDEFVVGFDNKVKEIRDWLTHGSKKLDIISIYGMPGLGKTTLAKKVYNDPFVKAHFNTCAWCTISQSYHSKTLMLDILKDITEVNDSFIKMEEEDLAYKLKKCLMGKRYLIVMDDLWDVGAWNALKLCFPDDEKHSRILFTSRIRNIVLSAKSDGYMYPLTQLADQESFELLERSLFKDRNVWPKKFVECGKKIARDCKGLPLAIVLVVGLLKKEIDNLDWWKRIGETLDSRIYEGRCFEILELSYKHLSDPLKACFLYLGLFEEDIVIQVQKLMNLWISEGFIQEKGKESVEIVAEEYLMDLISRSLLIINSKSSRGGVKTCRIHDLLREFCVEKSRKERFTMLLHGKNVSQDTCGHYRVSVQCQHLKHFVVQKSSPLHSIRICGTSTSNAFTISPTSFCHAIYLHVLDLEEVRFIGDFPKEITTLIFLRYLAIWCTAKSLPAAIDRLRKLETLRIIGEEEFVFPRQILQIQSLRHVHIGKFNLGFIFPTLHMLKNIQSLSTPCLTHADEIKRFASFLSKLKTIQKLKCRLYEQEKVLKLDFLNQLVSLNLFHEGRPLLRKFGFSLPSCIKKLTLSNFGLSWSELSRISKLQNLQVLKILVNAFNGVLWNMEAEEQFKNLKFLKLQSLNVHNWSASEENFPFLEHIVVEHCYKLKKIPIEFFEISSLKKIQIRRCRSSLVKSAKEIEDQQIELGNLKFEIEAVQILSEKLY